VAGEPQFELASPTAHRRWWYVFRGRNGKRQGPDHRWRPQRALVATRTGGCRGINRGRDRGGSSPRLMRRPEVPAVPGTCRALMVLHRCSCKTDGVREQAAGQIHRPEVWSSVAPGYDDAITPIMRPYSITTLYLPGWTGGIRLSGPARQQQPAPNHLADLPLGAHQAQALQSVMAHHVRTAA